MNETRKELQVSALENGTVIDHIPSQSVFMVINILGLEKSTSQILFGTNLESKKYGKKGIIKVSDKYFEDEEINKISLVAPSATLIVIKDFRVVEKKHVDIPDMVNKFLKCVNPNCITNHQRVATKFYVINKVDLKLQCHYCEKTMQKQTMKFT